MCVDEASIEHAAVRRKAVNYPTLGDSSGSAYHTAALHSPCPPTKSLQAAIGIYLHLKTAGKLWSLKS